MCKNCGEFANCNGLTKGERTELEELRSKVKIYEDLTLPEKFKEFYVAAWYSAKFAMDEGQFNVAKLEELYQEDLSSIINHELSNLDEGYNEYSVSE